MFYPENTTDSTASGAGYIGIRHQHVTGDIEAIAFGYPNASGDVITRNAAEEMAKLLEAKYPMYKTYFVNRSEDGSKGIVMLKFVPSEEK